jgi:glycosyltransferase involved in cell wall biosynthesis
VRILLIVVYYPPSETSAAQMMHALAHEFARLGHQVIVATPSEDSRQSIRIEEEDGITVVRIRVGALRKVGNAIRLWRESRISKTMWRHGKRFFRSNRCDLVVFYSPTIFFGELVGRLKDIWQCPSYLILRDIFPKWAVDTGILHEGIIYRYLKRKELGQYAVSDTIGVEAQGNLAYFDSDVPDARHRVEVLHNWVDVSETPENRSNWRNRLDLQNKVVFFYGGNLGKAQDLDNLLRLALSLQARQEIFFLLVGSGSEESRIKEEILRKKMLNIRLLPPLSQKEYLACLSEFDVGLISLDRRLNSHNFTGKLLGYVICGKPVLASINPGNDLIAFLQNADVGLACINGEDEKLREAAIRLASDSSLREQMGTRARLLGETTFSVRGAASRILSHLEKTQVGHGDQ